MCLAYLINACVYFVTNKPIKANLKMYFVWLYKLMALKYSHEQTNIDKKGELKRY